MSAKRGETYIQQCSELPEKEIQVRPAKDLYNSAERLQEAIEHSLAKIETLDMDMYLRGIATSC